MLANDLNENKKALKPGQKIEQTSTHGVVTASSRQEYLEGKTELTDEDIINILDLPCEKASEANIKAYTKNSYKELKEKPEELFELTEKLKSEQYFKYHNTYIAKSKLLFEQTEVLYNEIPCLIVLNEMKVPAYLLPFEYARESAGVKKEFADSLKNEYFTDFKRVFSSRINSAFKKGVRQGRDIFFLVNNERLEFIEIKEQLFKLINYHDVSDRSGTYIFFSEKDSKCYSFEVDKKGVATEKIPVDLKKIRLTLSDKPLPLGEEINSSSSKSIITDRHDTVNNINSVFESLLSRGAIEEFKIHRDIQNRIERYRYEFTRLEKLNELITSQNLKNSNQAFIQKEKTSRFYLDAFSQKTVQKGEEKTMEKTTEKKSIDVNTYRFGSGETIDEILSNQSTWKNDSDCLKNMIESNLNAVSDFANEKEQTLLKQLRNIMEQPETDLKELAVITDVATTYMAVKHFDQRLMDEGKRPYSKDFINVQAQKEFSYELPSWLKSSLEEFPNVDRMPSTEGTTEAEIDLDTITNEETYIRGVKITHEVPEGWRKAEGVQTTPLLTAPEENYKLSISNENFEKLSKYGKTLENLLREYNIAENFSKLTDKEAIEIYDILSDKKKYSGTNSVRREFLQKISEIKQNQLKEAENERRKEQTDRISENKSINTDGYTGILPDGKRVTAVEERNGRSNRIHEGQIQEDNLNSSKDLYNSQSNSLSPVEYLTQKINGSGITLHLSKEEMKAILDAGNDVQKMSVKFGTNQDVQVQEEASFGGYGTYVVSVLEENARQLGINIAARKYGGTFYINNQTLGDFLKSKNFSSFWNERLKQVKTNSVDYLSQEILRADVKGNSQLEKEQATLTSLFSLDLIEYKREQTFLYSVNIPDNSGTNYLMYNNPIGLENAERINEELSKLGVEWRASRNDIGKNIYFDLLGKNVFGGNQKQTSEFLINTGYVGLQMDNANYIIFNDKDMSITDRVQYMKDKDGEVYGFAYEGQIYVDEDLVNSNVLAHEYTHIWDSYIQKNNSQLWQTGKNILKGTSLWVEVTEDKNYENLKTDDEILSEIHARITGKFAEQVLEKIAKNDGELTKDRVIDWESEAEQFIAKELLIKPELGEENYTSDSVKAAYLKAFLSMPMKDLMNEVKLQVMQNEEIQQMTVRNRPDYMKTPFGQPSELSEKEWYMAHSRDFKEQYGDWEAEVKKNFLLSDNVVSTITGNEFQKDENISFFEQINKFYNSFGNNVESPLFGAVTLDEAGVDDSFAHGMSRIKAAAYASVGDVIKNGVIIDSDINHKGRGYNTYVVAAPIKINKDNYICEVVLKQNKNGYSFYLHEVTEQKKYLGEAFVTHLPQRAASQGTMSTEEAFITSLPQKAASQRTLATLLQNAVSVNQTISCPMSKNMEPEKEFVQKTILEKLQKQVINEVKTDVSLEEAISKAKISHEDVNVYGTPGGTVTLDFSNEPEAFKALTGENPEPYIKYDDNSQFHAEINLKILKDGSLYADVVLPSLINKTTNLSNLEDILKRNDKNFSDEIKNILQEKFTEITGEKADFDLKSEQIDDPVIKKIDVQPWMFKQETIEDAKRKEELENSKAVSSGTEQKKSEENKKKTTQKIDYIKKGAMDFLKAVENGTAPFLDKSIVDFGKITIEPREILNAQTGRAFSGQNQLLSQIYAKEQEMQSLIVTSMEGAKKAGTYIAKKDEAKKNYVLAFQKDQKLFHSRFFEPGAAENPNLIYSKFLEKQRPLKLKSLRECVVHYSRSAGDYDIANKYYQEIAKEHLKNIQAYIAVPDGKKPTIKDLEASCELLKNYFEFENVPEKERTFFEETYGILIDVEKERPVESFSAQSIETEIKKQQDFLMKNTFTETELGEYRKKEFEETVEQMQKEEKEQIDAREITEPEAYLGRYLAACSSNSEFVTDEKTIETVSKKLSENLKRNFQVENYEIIEEIGSQAAKIASEMVNKMSFDKAHSNDVKQAVKQDNDIKHPPVGMGGK